MSNVLNKFNILTRGGPQIGRLEDIQRQLYLELGLTQNDETSTYSKALLDVSRKTKRNFEKIVFDRILAIFQNDN